MPPCLDAVSLDDLVADRLSGVDRESAARHVASCPSCSDATARLRTVLASRDRRPTDPLPEGELAAVAHDVPSIPGYQLLQLIHRGGQGAVYRAVQLSTRRTVAIKLLSAGVIASPAERRRFEREVDILSALDHRNVVALIDSGSASGTPYLVMRFVEGEDLDAWARRVTPDPEQSVRLVVSACLGVEHAHQHGVLHRDLKPRNIRVDPAGEPLVLDFGLARPLVLGDADGSSLTLGGVFLGTLGFAAPEQLRGDARAIDARTDVHGLGAVLYWLLTARLPRPIGDDLRSALAQIDAAPEPPSLARPGVGADLDTVVLKAIDADPQRRYASVEALRRDLERVLAGEPVEARRDSRLYVLRRNAWLHRRALAVVAGLLVVMAAALVAVLVQRDAARLAQARAEEGEIAALAAARRAASESHRAEEEAEAARRVSDALTGLLQIPDAGPAGAENVRVVDALDRGASTLLPQLEGQPRVQARVAAVIGRAYLSLGRYQDAEPLIRRSVELHREHGGDGVEAMRALSALGFHARVNGKLEDSLAHYEAAHELALADPSTPPRAQVATTFHHAQALLEVERRDEALALLDEALALARRLLPDDRNLVRNIEDFATTSRAASLPDAEMRALLEESVERARALDGPLSSAVGNSANVAGVLFQTRGDLAASERFLREALAAFEAVNPPGHAQTAEVANNLGGLLAELGRHDEARPHVERAIRDLEAAGIVDTRVMGTALLNRLVIEVHGGTPAAARAAVKGARDWYAAHPGVDEEGAVVLRELVESAASERGRQARGSTP